MDQNFLHLHRVERASLDPRPSDPCSAAPRGSSSYRRRGAPASEASGLSSRGRTRPSCLLYNLWRLALGGLPRVGVRAQGAAEKEDVRLRAVDLVVHPAQALLHAEHPPLHVLQQAPALGDLVHLPRDCLRENHVPVLIHVVKILLRVLDLVRVMRHRPVAICLVRRGGETNAMD
eukprot:CAMPEP_0179228248 /NCGR_PEP_ID=MMETSP0797-20121207/9729_1 /TAXON_ID=47934 /ORGANISM="Dinophysis acuminata, Strain DAEP01" /LENGTH=174 /DNA_ID=CAMNT_0020935297 /DNA_START=191 /DNA_END=715 /DNA_ORIENTATION=+